MLVGKLHYINTHSIPHNNSDIIIKSVVNMQRGVEIVEVTKVMIKTDTYKK